MNTNNPLKAKIIFGIYLIATSVLLLLGYSVQKPAIPYQEFPFTITYSYEGTTQTISDIYAVEYHRGAKYIGDHSIDWYGYIKNGNRLYPDFFRIAELDGATISVNLNLEPGYLMGDPQFTGSGCQPTAVYQSFDGMNETEITDPTELEKLGFRLISWEYPEPIGNSFAFGGISLSSEAVILTSAIAVIALLACMVLVKKDKEIAYRKMDKVSIVLNFLIAIAAFPFIFTVSALSEILADTSIWQQFLYFTPALTLLGIGASVTLRRLGYKCISFWIQFAGPVVFALLILIVNP